MGYECPVCEIPQVDGGHLANHMAFTAIVHGDDHESWLDETVPEWSEMGEAELAEQLLERAETTEFPQVFEDTTDGHDHHGHSHDRDHEDERSGTLFDENASGRGGRQQPVGTQPAALDADAQAVLEEARRLTETRLDETADADEQE